VKAGEAQHHQHGTDLKEQYEKGGIVVPAPPPAPLLRPALGNFFLLLWVAMWIVVAILMAILLFGVGGGSTGSDFRPIAFPPPFRRWNLRRGLVATSGPALVSHVRTNDVMQCNTGQAVYSADGGFVCEEKMMKNLPKHI
jgi:hypothetical protein